MITGLASNLSPSPSFSLFFSVFLFLSLSPLRTFRLSKLLPSSPCLSEQRLSTALLSFSPHLPPPSPISLTKLYDIFHKRYRSSAHEGTDTLPSSVSPASRLTILEFYSPPLFSSISLLPFRNVPHLSPAFFSLDPVDRRLFDFRTSNIIG